MRKLVNDYGTILILLVLGLALSWLTLDDQTPEGEEAGAQVAAKIVAMSPKPKTVLIAIRDNQVDARFASAASAAFAEAGIEVVATVKGTPPEAMKIARAESEAGRGIDAFACTAATGVWPVLNNIRKLPGMERAETVAPEVYRWPTFLKKDNLINISNQTVVISTIAIGMTMVIITGGIELSVGSLIAFASCLAAYFIKNWGGAESATTSTMVMYCALAILICGVMGFFTGGLVTLLGIPPFICTLATMMVSKGLAYIISGGYTIFELPGNFTYLGRGTPFWGIPISVIICLALYIIAHVLMSSTTIGRYIYSVGGNREAARLSGVPVKFVLFFVYTVTAMLAGFGGIITASQLKAGAPIYGVGYEMFVIASTVVGGTSLAGGEGKIFGTLIGSFIIATIQNGMNLMGVGSYTQQVVLGLVILVAVVLDRLKQSELFWRRRPRKQAAAG